MNNLTEVVELSETWGWGADKLQKQRPLLPKSPNNSALFKNLLWILYEVIKLQEKSAKQYIQNIYKYM